MFRDIPCLRDSSRPFITQAQTSWRPSTTSQHSARSRSFTEVWQAEVSKVADELYFWRLQQAEADQTSEKRVPISNDESPAFADRCLCCTEGRGRLKANAASGKCTSRCVVMPSPACRALSCCVSSERKLMIVCAGRCTCDLDLEEIWMPGCIKVDVEADICTAKLSRFLPDHPIRLLQPRAACRGVLTGRSQPSFRLQAANSSPETVALTASVNELILALQAEEAEGCKNSKLPLIPEQASSSSPGS